MIERFKKRIDAYKEDMQSSICDENRIFIEGVIYGLQFAEAALDATAKAYDLEMQAGQDEMAGLAEQIQIELEL